MHSVNKALISPWFSVKFELILIVCNLSVPNVVHRKLVIIQLIDGVSRMGMWCPGNVWANQINQTVEMEVWLVE